MLALNNMLNPGIEGAGKCKALVDNVPKSDLVARYTKMKEAEACIRALQREMAGLGVDMVVLPPFGGCHQRAAGAAASGAMALSSAGQPPLREEPPYRSSVWRCQQSSWRPT